MSTLSGTYKDANKDHGTVGTRETIPTVITRYRDGDHFIVPHSDKPTSTLITLVKIGNVGERFTVVGEVGKEQGTRYYHAVPVDPDQPRDQPRFSLVFRPITDHPKGAKSGEHLAVVDEAKATRVRPGGDK